jgi:hypothetical protein
LAELGERIHQLAKEATRLAALTTDPSSDPTGFDRAMSALRMYDARVAIEELDAALARVDTSGSGTRQGSPPTSGRHRPQSAGAGAG